MKRSIERTGIALVFSAVWIVSMTAPAQAAGPCSLERAAGKWGFTDNGTVVGVGPRIATGVLTLDAAGNLLDGIATSSLNGTIADETFSGTYTVNADCTGTLTGEIYISGVLAYTVTLNLAFDENMAHMRGLFTSAVESNGTSLPTVVALDANRQ